MKAISFLPFDMEIHNPEKRTKIHVPGCSHVNPLVHEPEILENILSENANEKIAFIFCTPEQAGTLSMMVGFIHLARLLVPNPRFEVCPVVEGRRAFTSMIMWGQLDLKLCQQVLYEHFHGSRHTVVQTKGQWPIALLMIPMVGQKNRGGNK